MSDLKQTVKTLARLLELLKEKRKARTILDLEIQTLVNARDKLKKYNKKLCLNK